MILEVIAKEKEVSAAVKKLQEDLSSERHQHEAEVEERNEIISKLKEELQEVRTKSAIETKYLQKESRARLQSLNRIYYQSTSELDEQIWKVRKQLEIEVLANRESEEFLKRKVVSLQKDAGDWMQRYETDFEELEKAILKSRVNEIGAMLAVPLGRAPAPERVAALERRIGLRQNGVRS